MLATDVLDRDVSDGNGSEQIINLWLVRFSEQTDAG